MKTHFAIREIFSPAVNVLIFLLISSIVMLSCQLPLNPTFTNITNKGITEHVTILHDVEGNTLVLAPVMIGGQGPYQFLIDTGASVTLINRSLAQHLNLPKSGNTQKVSGIGGTELAVPVSISDWHLGQINLPEATIVSSTISSSKHGDSETNEEGLLGSDILSQFGAVTVDYADQTITVYRQIAYENTSVTFSPFL